MELLLQTDRGRVIESLVAREHTISPAHFDAEVLQTFRRLVRTGALTAEVAAAGLERCSRLGDRVPLQGLLAEAFTQRDRFSGFDTLCAVAARMLGARLVTGDGGLARAADGYAEVELV